MVSYLSHQSPYTLLTTANRNVINTGSNSSYRFIINNQTPTQANLSSLYNESI